MPLKKGESVGLGHGLEHSRRWHIEAAITHLNHNYFQPKGLNGIRIFRVTSSKLGCCTRPNQEWHGLVACFRRADEPYSPDYEVISFPGTFCDYNREILSSWERDVGAP